MKKLSCLVLVFCLVMPCISAQAATASDFQAYIETLPSEFLEAMIAMFNAELARRGEATASAADASLDKEVTVPIGVYVVGEDIPAGTYTIKSTGRYFYYSVYTDTGSPLAYGSILAEECVGKITLENGYTVEIEYSPVIFAPYKGLGF